MSRQNFTQLKAVGDGSLVSLSFSDISCFFPEMATQLLNKTVILRNVFPINFPAF